MRGEAGVVKAFIWGVVSVCESEPSGEMPVNCNQKENNSYYQELQGPKSVTGAPFLPVPSQQALHLIYVKLQA